MMNAAKQPGGQGRAVVCYAKGLNGILKSISAELKTKISKVKGQNKGTLKFVQEDTWHNTIMPLGKWNGGTSCNKENLCCWSKADKRAASIFETKPKTERFTMKIGPKSLTAKHQDKNNIIKIYPTFPTVQNMNVDTKNKEQLKKKFGTDWEKTPHITIAYITKNLSQEELNALETWRISALAQLKEKEFTCVPEIAFFDAVVGNWGGITKNIRKC